MNSKIANLFTIVIISKELCSLTRVCLEEILKQYPEIQIKLIVDNICDCPWSNVEQIQSSSPNLSFKRNLGVELADTKYIAFIDSDAYPYPNWLEEALKAFSTLENVGLLGGANLKYSLAGDQEIPYLAYTSKLLNNEPSPERVVANYNTVASSNMLFEKEKYIKIGGMRTSLYTGEDIDLSVRFSKKYINYFVGAVRVGHKQRNFKNFLKQRYVWGRGIFNVLSHTFPSYLTSIIPFLFIIGMMILFILDISLFIKVLLLYFLICLIESVRTAGFRRTLFVFPYVFSSIPVMGLGALVALFRGDIDNNFSLYSKRD